MCNKIQIVFHKSITPKNTLGVFIKKKIFSNVKIVIKHLVFLDSGHLKGHINSVHEKIKTNKCDILPQESRTTLLMFMKIR